VTDVGPSDIEPLLPEYLARQRWFADEGDIGSATVTSFDIVRKGTPGLVWVLIDVDGAAYQLVLGTRPAADLPEFLHGKDRVTLGVHDETVVYDALVDPELAIDVLREAAPDEDAEVARPLVVEQSNSSVVYDERLILKLFRRIHREPNPDVEVARLLSNAGFPHVVPQLAELRREGADLAVVREYLLGCADGWHVAQTSLRDLFAARLPPEECGADFAPEAARVGEVVATLHLALADLFGTEAGDPASWVKGFHTLLDRTEGSFDRDRVGELFERAASVEDGGRSTRVHGDLHLGQVLHADSGWYVIDFEGEPARPVAERVAPSSPLRDVAGMQRSFHYAARSALLERFVEIDDELEELALAWEQRAFSAFVDAYVRTEGIDELLPRSDEDRQTLLAAFELDKAVYELGYEQAHRPDWVAIPRAAIERTLQRS
jgi:maltokinase